MKNISMISRRSFLKATAACAAAASALTLTGCGASSASSASSAASSAAGTADSTSAAVSEGKSEFKVGIVNYVDDASLNQIVASIEAQLDAVGVDRGVSFNYADYYSNAQADQPTLNQIAANLIAEQVDVIVAIATPTANVMRAATEDTPIPVVFSAVSDPVGTGLDAVENMTGTSDALDTESVMKLITAVKPEVKKIGLLYDLGQDSATQPILDAKAFCDANGIAYEEKTGTTTSEVQMAAEALIAAGVEAVFTPTDNTIMTAELAIYEKFIEAGIPHFTGADSFALNGAFCGYGVDYEQLGVATADMIVKVLCDGKKPADLPFETFDNGIATINTETCAALGLDFATVKAAIEPLCTTVQEIVTAESFS